MAYVHKYSGQESDAKESIRRQFDDVQRIGKVKQVDIITKYSHKHNYMYHQAFVHFEYFYDNVASRKFVEKVIKEDPDNPALFVYSDPLYSICVPNKSRKTSPNNTPSVLSSVTNSGRNTPQQSCDALDATVLLIDHLKTQIISQYVSLKELQKKLEQSKELTTSLLNEPITSSSVSSVTSSVHAVMKAPVKETDPFADFDNHFTH